MLKNIVYKVNVQRCANNMEMAMRYLISILVVFAFILQPAYAVKYPPDMTDHEPPPNEFGVHPINDSFSYRITAGPLPPAQNPSPNQVNVGDEIIQIAYTDDFGQLYDVQANLTNSVVKIFRGGQLVRQAVISEQEKGIFRQSGTHITSSAPAIGPLILALITVVLGTFITVTYGEYADRRACQRAANGAFNNFVNTARACISRPLPGDGRTWHFETIRMPDASTCGADTGAGNCVLH